MGKPQFIHTDDDQILVVLTQADYDALMARAGDEDSEDAMTRHIVETHLAARAAGEDFAVPQALWDEREQIGKPPLRDLRMWRKMTQRQLAEAVGVEQGYISALENYEREASVKVLTAIAKALQAPLELLTSP